MLANLKTAFTRLRKRFQRPPQTPRLTERDVFLVSYPRSGNTWVRFLIANVLKPAGVEIDFHNVQDYVPELGRNNDIISRMESPRVVKSHSLYESSYPRVIYLVRDGRDVYVSYYHYRKNQLDESETLGDFIRREDHYPSSWSDHVRSWLGSSGDRPNLLLVRYEDLLERPLEELKRMVDFIGLDVTGEQLAQAIQDSSFSEMRRIDQTKGRKYNLTGTKDFVRKGKAGSWQDEFSAEDIAYLKAKEGDLLIELGYEADQNW